MGETGFGKIRNTNEFEEYRGEEDYVVIHTPNNRIYSGKVNKVDDDFVFLLPFVGVEWDAEKGITRKLINNKKPEKIRRSDVSSITPTTEKDVLAYYQFLNSHPETEINGTNKPKEKK